MFHSRSLSDDLTDWVQVLLKNEDCEETVVEPTKVFNSAHDHVDTTVYGEIITHDVRFIPEDEIQTSEFIEAGHAHSYNEYTDQSKFGFPSTSLYQHQKSNTKELDKDCLDNLYSITNFNDNSYLGNDNWNGRSERSFQNEQYWHEENVASFNGESSDNFSKIGEESLHDCQINISPNIASHTPAGSHMSVQLQHTISRPSIYDTSVVAQSRDNSKLKSYVDHTYINFSKVDDRFVTESSRIVGEKLHAILCYGGPLSNDHLFALGDTTTKRTVRRLKKRKNENFPSRLMTLLSDDPDSSIITWLPHGRSFIIKDQKRFIDEIHHRYFKRSKFKTFQRMLNLWGMKVITFGSTLSYFIILCLT